jgi:hypothetical protein
MTDDEKQTAYAAKRATITRPIRHIGGETMDNPPTITYRADMEAETRARMAAAGFEFADEAPGKGNFW